MIFSQILLAIITLPLLFVITFVNTENIFQNNFLEIYTLIYGIYFFLSTLGLILFKYFKINNSIIKQEISYTIKFIFYTCLLVLPAIWLVHYFILGTLGGTGLYLRSYGKVTFVYLVFALSISPIKTFIKNKKISDGLILIRKIIGILSFVFFLKHGLEYFSMEYLFSVKHNPAIGYLDYVWKNIIIRNDALSGIVAGILMFIIGITSNKFSMRFLSGNLRKKVQSLAYPVFLITSIHIAFSSRFDSFYILLILWLVSIRLISYRAQKDKPQTGTTTKYICTPCGYIYDEAVGDPDGGLEPGTKFEDIPDSRVCPICGVTKLGFEPYYEAPNAIFSGYISKVVGYTMLTKDVLELSLKIVSPLPILPGQYILLCLKDFDGEFSRAYSVVEKIGDTIKLGIKIKDIGRGGRNLKTLKIGDTLKIKGVYGNFVLKTTNNPKVFIATGTGISPLFNMIANNNFSKNNILFWGLAMKEDLFYLEKIKAFKNLKFELFFSKEKLDQYHYGRIDTSLYDFSLDTEFYLCGNSAMVTQQVKFLKSKGYKNIYLEIF